MKNLFKILILSFVFLSLSTVETKGQGLQQYATELQLTGTSAGGGTLGNFQGAIQFNYAGIMSGSPRFYYNLATATLYVDSQPVQTNTFVYSNQRGGSVMSLSPAANSTTVIDSLSGTTDTLNLTLPLTADASNGNSITIKSTKALTTVNIVAGSYMGVTALSTLKEFVLYWSEEAGAWF